MERQSESSQRDPTVANDSQKIQPRSSGQLFHERKLWERIGKELIRFTGPAVLIIHTAFNYLAHGSIYCVSPDSRPLRICIQATTREKTSCVIYQKTLGTLWIHSFFLFLHITTVLPQKNYNYEEVPFSLTLTLHRSVTCKVYPCIAVRQVWRTV